MLNKTTNITYKDHPYMSTFSLKNKTFVEHTDLNK